MGYKTELQSNNADLQTILNKVNALPEAGGGGGGGSVETCTVEISASTSPTQVAYISALDGTYTRWSAMGPGDYPQPFTCVCNSLIFLNSRSNLKTTNAELVQSNVYFITAPAGGKATFTY